MFSDLIHDTSRCPDPNCRDKLEKSTWAAPFFGKGWMAYSCDNCRKLWGYNSSKKEWRSGLNFNDLNFFGI